MKKLFLSIFLFLPTFVFANDWVPLKDNIETNKVLKKLGSGQISYCIDGTQTKVIPNVNKVFQIWFDNVLSYRDIYPDFNKTFKDILPILERKDKMVLQQCATPFNEGKIKGFLSQRKNYKFASSKPLLRLAFCKNKECLGENVAGSCQRENVFEKRIFIATDGKDPVGTLLHEFGHVFSLGDIKYNQQENDKTYGYNTANTYLFNDKYLTCDDADGIVALIYMGLGKEKTFHSFCGYIVFKQGQNSHWEGIKSEFTKEGKRYKVLRDLNRHFNKPLLEERKAFNEKKLTLALQESVKDSKDLNNLL